MPSGCVSRLHADVRVVQPKGDDSKFEVLGVHLQLVYSRYFCDCPGAYGATASRVHIVRRVVRGCGGALIVTHGRRRMAIDVGILQWRKRVLRVSTNHTSGARVFRVNFGRSRMTIDSPISTVSESSASFMKSRESHLLVASAMRREVLG